MSPTKINTLVSPILSSPFIQSFAPTSLAGAFPNQLTPHAWLCCHCIHYDTATNSQNPLAAADCEHCQHPRCGLCDSIIDDSSVSVSGEGLLFHLDEGQKKAMGTLGLRDEKTGHEWTLGHSHVGAGSVMAAAGVVGVVTLVGAVVVGGL